MPKKRGRESISQSDDFRGFLEEFDRESDRAAGILAAAFLDEHLKHLIAGFLVDDSKEVDNLLGVNRPLGSFSSRICAAYCMGLIGEEEFHDLLVVRDIRNRFAHELHGLDFSDEWVEDKCHRLRLSKTAPKWPVQTGARNPFTVASALLTMNLLRRAAQFHAKRRVVPSSFEDGETVA